MPNTLFDPTLVYILLMVGLWMGATSVFIAGTGLPEFASLTILGVAFYALLAMPTNWAGVMLILVGIAPIILVPIVRPQYRRYAEFGLIAQAVGSVILFRGMMPNPTIIVLMMAIVFAYNRFIMVKIGDRMQEFPQVGNEMEALIGAQGRVVAPVMPPNTGTAQINGELWTIRSETELQAGDIVAVIETQGLEVHVERVKPKRPPKPEVAAQSNGVHPENIQP